ncbi:MAG: 6-phosphogluconolactonase [Gammaproteobacteria bacterium]
MTVLSTSSDPAAQRYADTDSLARALAAQIAGNLVAGISARGTSSLVVSGGRSPIKLFEILRKEPLDWSRVCIALADERWVAPEDAASNERLVREYLLKDGASAARFLGLKNAAPTPDLGAVSAWETFARVPRPFDSVVLGMGDDGHTASLFPRSPNLPSALNRGAAAGCVAMWSPEPPQPRLSLNLTALLDARRIVLTISGKSKWRTYAAACAPGPETEMPVRAVLRQSRTPLQVMWAP